LKPAIDLEKELNLLGMLDKAKEIYSQIGEEAALSYIKSSYRLLSKIYHPDLHQKDPDKA
jgi:curved DNA-binding protein CbpA